MKKKCTAIVLAAGQGKRMGTKVQKQYLLLAGKPVLYYSLKAFQDSEVIDDIYLVTGKGDEEFCRKEIVDKYGFQKVSHILCGGAERYHYLVTGKGDEEFCRKEIVDKYGFQKVSHILCGGAERYHSVWNALQNLAEEGYVFIHDGARPFVSPEIISRAYEEVQNSGACVVGMPVKDTIKIADENDNVAVTPERSRVWMVQTPQVFETMLVKNAYAKLIESGNTSATEQYQCDR